MRRPRRPAQDLRFSVECLPRRTRMAMLDGIETSSIIVGAYTDRDGGVCPMLAAHRRGGRTNLASFARAWDRYTSAGKRSRKATDREVHTLSSMLRASLVRDESVRGEFAEAVAEFKAVKARRAAEADAAAEAERARVAAEASEGGADTALRGDAQGNGHAVARAGAAPGDGAGNDHGLVNGAGNGDGDRGARIDTGERDRSDELHRRPGWSWLRVFRRYDEYEAALERMERAERELERREIEHERREIEHV